MSEQYTKNSIISKNKQHLDELINAHWAYIEQLLSLSCSPGQAFDLRQMMKIREFDYKAVARHFYKHGWEDAMIA